MRSDRQGQEEEQTLQRCKEIFAAFDKDGDGSITELELGALLRSLGVKPNAEQIEALFSRGDRDRNGLIDFGEFLQLLRGGSDASGVCSPSGNSNSTIQEGGEEYSYQEEELRTLFKAFDKDGNGYITAAELAHSMARMGRRLSFRELTDMMAEADLDGDGRISFEEFVSTLSGKTSRGN